MAELTTLSTALQKAAEELVDHLCDVISPAHVEAVGGYKTLVALLNLEEATAMKDRIFLPQLN